MRSRGGAWDIDQRGGGEQALSGQGFFLPGPSWGEMRFIFCPWHGPYWGAFRGHPLRRPPTLVFLWGCALACVRR